MQTIWIDQIRARDVRKEEQEDAAEQFGSDLAVRQIEARIRLGEVKTALNGLPPEQRAALMLVTVEGLSYKEAAQIAQVPVGTIMSRLARARIALEARLSTGSDRRRSLDNATAN